MYKQTSINLVLGLQWRNNTAVTLGQFSCLLCLGFFCFVLKALLDSHWLIFAKCGLNSRTIYYSSQHIWHIWYKLVMQMREQHKYSNHLSRRAKQDGERVNTMSHDCERCLLFACVPIFLFPAISRILSQINGKKGLSLKPDLFTCYL